MHWIDESRARLLIGYALKKDGWNVYGMKKDESDSMTDYFSPAMWIEGIAEKDGYVFVTQGSSTPGGFTITKQVFAGPCDFCAGKGTDPNGWTFEQAKAEPERFNSEHLKKEFPDSTGMRSLFPGVISPLHFKDGIEKCHHCHGSGEIYNTVKEFVPRPQYTHVQKGYTWHLEKNNKVIYRGKGLSKCINGYDANPAGIQELLDKVHKAMNMRKQTTHDPAYDSRDATSKQLWYLHVLTGLDTRGMKLTISDASEYINRAKSGQRKEVTEELTHLKQVIGH